MKEQRRKKKMKKGGKRGWKGGKKKGRKGETKQKLLRDFPYIFSSMITYVV